MAAVTVNGNPSYNISGSLRDYVYNVTIATTGDTLSTNLATIKAISFNDTTGITKAAPGTGANSGVITFTTTGGAVTGAEVRVLGY